VTLYGEPEPAPLTGKQLRGRASLARPLPVQAPPLIVPLTDPVAGGAAPWTALGVSGNASAEFALVWPLENVAEAYLDLFASGHGASRPSPGGKLLSCGVAGGTLCYRRGYPRVCV
jgi:hypothetical protein